MYYIKQNVHLAYIELFIFLVYIIGRDRFYWIFVKVF